MKLDDLTLRELLESIGARTPVPGGGAVASIVAALAASLARMVVAFSQGKKSLAAHEALHVEALASLDRLRDEALDLADEDARAFARLGSLWKLPAEDERRRREWAGAVQAAIDAPARVLETCRAVLAVLERLDGATNRSLRSDLAIAAHLAAAGAHAAAWNIRINLPQLPDAARAAALEAETESALAAIDEVAQRIGRAGAGAG